MGSCPNLNGEKQFSFGKRPLVVWETTRQGSSGICSRRVDTFENQSVLGFVVAEVAKTFGLLGTTESLGEFRYVEFNSSPQANLFHRF
jgi:hypothetical protein